MEPSKDVKTQMPAWHPNFRIEATLPDTKVIRTSFLVNAAAAGVLALLAWLLVSREMEVAAVNAEIASTQAEIAKLTVTFKKAEPLQKQFSELEKRFAEVENFRKGGWPAALFLERISATLPRMVTIDGIDMQRDVVLLRGSISGAPEKATATFNEYLAMLTKDAVLAKVAENIRQKSVVGRDAQMGRLTFSIEMKPKFGN